MTANPSAVTTPPAAAEGREEAPGLPSITVVVPAHNEEDLIERCVRSCWEQTHRPDEVIVVADSCTDRTAEVAARAGARVVETEFQLKAKNINHVLLLVGSEVMAVIDADSYYSSTSLEHFARTFAEGADATCAALFPMPEQRTSMIVAYRRFLYAVDKRWGRPIQQSVGRFYVLAGPASAFRVSALRAVGGYPERKGEDAFLTWELYRHGYRIGFTGEATVYTLEPTTWRSYFKQTDRWHSDFCQLTAAYWREYRKPRVLLVSGGAIWDTISYPVVLAYWLGSRIVNGSSGWSIPPVIWWLLLAVMVAQTVVAIKGLGFRRALAYLPPFILLAHADILQKFWIIIREWVLGRHATTWTGRQGRKAELTPMPAGRRRVFTGSVAVVALWTVLAFGTTAGVMEAAGVLPPLPDAGNTVIEKVPPVTIEAGDRRREVAMQPTTQPTTQPPASSASAQVTPAGSGLAASDTPASHVGPPRRALPASTAQPSVPGPSIAPTTTPSPKAKGSPPTRLHPSPWSTPSPPAIAPAPAAVESLRLDAAALPPLLSRQLQRQGRM